MVKIGYYQTNQEFLVKSFCKLAEKSYYNFAKTLVIIDNQELIDQLDRALWTYSKQHFIPHAKIDDPLPEEQPVLLCGLLSVIDQAVENIIVVNLDQKKLIELMASFPEKNIIKKISLINDEENNISKESLVDFFNKSTIAIETISVYHQLSLDKWKDIT